MIRRGGMAGFQSIGVPAGRPGSPLAPWCSAAVLVAVAAAFDPWGLRPFTTWRWVAVGVAACAAAASATWRSPRPFLVAWAALLIGMGVATSLALDPLMALVGHPRRHFGLVGWIVCALSFLAGTGVHTADARRLLGRAAVVAAGVTGAGAVADLAGWDPAGTRFAGARVGGLLGQPTYLGAVAVLLAPVALGVAAEPSMGRCWRWMATVAAASCGLALVTSETRGAWLGAAIGAGVGWRAIASWARSRRRFAAAVVFLAVLVVVGPLGGRGLAGVDREAPGGRGRIDEWALAVSVVADHPVTGVGPEGYRIAAPRHIDDGYARRHGRAEVVDRAHSGPLDVAASAGLPAAMVHLALLGGVLTRCARAIRRSGSSCAVPPVADSAAGAVRSSFGRRWPPCPAPGKRAASTVACGPGPEPMVAGAAVGVVAWAVQQLVSFPTVEVDPAAWLLAGVVVVVVEPRSRVVPHAAPLRVFAGLLACVLAAGGAVAVIADRELHRAERRAAVSPSAAQPLADRATALRPDDIDAWYLAAQIASSRPGLLAVDAGLDRVEAGLRWSPRDPALGALHEALLVERALRSQLPADLDAAVAAAEAGSARDPAGPMHHRHLGLVLAARGDDKGAEIALRRALDLDPDDSVARDALRSLNEQRGT